MTEPSSPVILLIEDEAIIALSQKQALEKFGYTVFIAHTGEEAIKKVQETTPSLILMDIDLGKGINGIETAQRILTNQDIPIIFLSSHTEPELIRQTETITSYGYMLKGTPPIVLDTTIKMALKLFHSLQNEQKQQREKDAIAQKLLISLQSIGDAVIVTDTDGRVTLINPIAEKLLETNSSAVIGLPIENLFTLSDAKTHEPKDNPVTLALQTGSTITLSNNTLLTTPTGKNFHIADTASPIINTEGNLEGVVLVFRDISKEYTLKQKLSENENRLSKIMLASQDGFWDWNLATDEVYFSPRYYTMAGYDEDEFPHQADEFWKRIHPEDLSFVKDEVLKHLRGETSHFIVEFRFLRKDGQWMWILGRGLIVERDENGNPLRFVGTHTDITERKVTESQLLQIKSRYQALIHQSFDGIVLIDQNGQVIEWNPLMEKFTGIPSSEAIGHFIWELMVRVAPLDLRSPSLYNELKNGFFHLLEGSQLDWEGIIREQEILRTDNIPLFVSTLSFRLRNPSETILCTIMRDITSQKQTEKQLRESEELFRNLANSTPIAILIYQDNKWVYANPAAESMTEYSLDEILNMNFWDIVHPQDKPTVIERGKKRQAGFAAPTSYEFRIITKSGKTKWAFLHGTSTIFHGKPAGLISVIDITERKEIEEKLHQSEETYRNLFQNAPVGLFRSRVSDGLILECNDQLAKIFGYEKREDIIGKLVSSQNYVDIEQRHRMLEIIQKQGFVENYEVLYRRRDGTPFWARYSAKIYPEKEWIEGVFQDITEEKKAKALLEQQIQEKETILRETHHRIKNNIASLVSLLRLQMNETKSEEAIRTLQDAVSRVESMRILYDKLLLSPEYRFLSTKTYIEDLAEAVLCIFSNREMITLITTIEDFEIDVKKLFPLGIIINEALTNAAKYAFPHQKGTIHLSLARKNQFAELTIQDNGKGLPHDFDITTSKGFGMQLLQILSHQLVGELIIQSNHGTWITLRFPL